jgi:hypothetical protein
LNYTYKFHKWEAKSGCDITSQSPLKLKCTTQGSLEAVFSEQLNIQGDAWPSQFSSYMLGTGLQWSGTSFTVSTLGTVGSHTFVGFSIGSGACDLGSPLYDSGYYQIDVTCSTNATIHSQYRAGS